MHFVQRMILTVGFAICNIATLIAQTDRQVSLVDDFCKYHASTLIRSWAHPTCTERSYSIEHYGHSYYLKVTYEYEGRYFTCEYKIGFSTYGELQSFSHFNCGNIWLSCFDVCDIAKSGTSALMDQKDNEKCIKMVGKALSQFTCTDACFARLYLKWRNLGYYNSY